ncbi:MAG: M42 family peptidase, partial [Ruminococcus sp.]|nr:M42 family peptidase [Ruminococcus sp.]
KKGVTGGNDSGTIHNSRGGVRTSAISLPCRYLHSPCGVIAESDLNAVCELVHALAEKAAMNQ